MNPISSSIRSSWPQSQVRQERGRTREAVRAYKGEERKGDGFGFFASAAGGDAFTMYTFASSSMDDFRCRKGRLHDVAGGGGSDRA